MAQLSHLHGVVLPFVSSRVGGVLGSEGERRGTVTKCQLRVPCEPPTARRLASRPRPRRRHWSFGAKPEPGPNRREVSAWTFRRWPQSSNPLPRSCSPGTWRRPRSGSPTSTCRGAEGGTSSPGTSGGTRATSRTPPVRSALFINLLTEDNLPYYFRTLSDFGRDGVWGEWTRRWTAEEGRHAIVIRDYLTVTRAIDPIALERGRMQQVSTGVTPEITDLCDALCLHDAPGARDTHRAPQHGKPARRPRGQGDHEPRGSRTRTCTTSSTGTWRSRRSDFDPSAMVIAMDRTVRGLHDARHRHPGLRRSTLASSRPPASTTTRSSSRRCCSR